MNARLRRLLAVIGAGVLALAAPSLFPAIMTQLTFLWIMIVFALTWDLMGGQMGYNSFGNILFFGVGMYATAVAQIGLYYDVAAYTASSGSITVALSEGQYFTGLGVGLIVGAVLAAALAVLLGAGVLGLRGHYFAISTLGLGIAGGELAGGWDYIGAGSGMVTPQFPGALGSREIFFYFASLALAVLTFLALRRLYASRFGLVVNAIRDDEDKAEAMGIHTARYKSVAWAVSALFLGLAGGLVGNIVGFIDPRDVAFASASWGVWMILMAILGGKGTLWGPVIGAAIFDIAQELFWTYLLGWQRVALGALILVIVLFFPQGIVGWLRARRPAPAGDGHG